MPGWAWAGVAAIAGVAMEAVYKKTNLEFFSLGMMLMVFFAQLTIAAGIYHLVKSTDSLVAATIIFSSTTLTIRVALTLLWGDPVTRGTWVGLVLMALARLAQSFL